VPGTVGRFFASDVDRRSGRQSAENATTSDISELGLPSGPMPSDRLDLSAAAQATAAVGAISDLLGDDLFAVYLHGSAVDGRLRPDSDLDLFAVARVGLEPPERRRIVAALSPISARRLRPAGWRALDVTVVAQDAVRPWRYPPTMELQFGEWLRDAFDRGDVEPDAVTRPDLAILVSMVRATGCPLFGPPADELLDPVPPADVRRAMVDSLPELLTDLADDTRNVLLTLARMWCTSATGEIRSKDAAADWALNRLPEHLQEPMRRARKLYLDGGYGDWAGDPVVEELASSMAAAVRTGGRASGG
jgi:predicted nucleotidyltransferase